MSMKPVRFGGRARAARSVICLLAATGLATLAAAQDPAIHLEQSSGQSSLSLVGGPAFRATTATVLNPRVVPLPQGAAVALWEERDAAGLRQSFYALSTDGLKVFRAVETDNLVRLRYRSFDPLTSQPGIPEGLAAQPGSSLYLVQFVAPPLEPMRDAVRALGGTVHQFLTEHTHIVALPPGAAANVAALPFVRWVGPYHTAYKLDAGMIGEALAAARGADSGIPALYSIQVVERGPAPQQAVANAVRALGGVVRLESTRGVRMEATLTPAQLIQIASMDEVQFIDPSGPPGNDMNIVREIGGADAIEIALGSNGQGVRGEVLDSGLRVSHLAFQNPAPLIHTGNSFDSSHGTSVFGIVFGNGVVVPNGRGMLPGRDQGIFASYANLAPFNPAGVQRAVHTAELVNPGGPYRAVFQTNSWGTGLVTNYTTISAEMDDIVFDTGLFHTQSQSNTGNQFSRPQAWAKNVLSVGGVEHKDTIFRIDDEWTGASIGPASDQRIKPEVSHFFDKVLTPSDLTNTSYTPDFNGTSAATPIVAGHAGLIFQMWHEGVFPGFGGGSTVFADRPQFTTVKALLINSAYQYTFTSSADNLSRDKQGWGMPDLAPILAAPQKFFIVNETNPLTPLSSKSYAVAVQPDTPELKITMAYSDPMGNPSAQFARINDLTLRVVSPGGTAYFGNNGLKEGNWSTSGGVSNKRDTVENVFVQNPQAGTWTIEILGDQIIQDANPQTPGIDADFALVAWPVSLVQPVAISLPAGAPSLLTPGVPAVIDVEIQPGTQLPVPSTAKLHYRMSGTGAFTAVPMQHLGGSSYRATIPAPTCATPAQTPRYYFSCQGDGGGTTFDPLNAPTTTYAAQVGAMQILYQDNFEGDAGWIVQNTNVLAGPWERGVPEGIGQEGDPPTDFDGSGKCWTTGLAPLTDLDGGPTTLTSTIFNLAGKPEARLTYARWAFTNDPAASDNLKVMISNDNGATWNEIESVADLNPGWVLRTVRVADYTPPTASMRLRVSISDNPANSTTEGGLDAFKFTSLVCVNPCYADCNQAGGLTIADFGCFQSRFAAGDPYADCNASGTLTIADFGCFQSKFAAGCP